MESQSGIILKTFTNAVCCSGSHFVKDQITKCLTLLYADGFSD